MTPLTTNQTGFHLQVRNVHQLKNGDILAAHEGEGAIREYDLNGKLSGNTRVWKTPAMRSACRTAIRSSRVQHKRADRSDARR